MVCVRPEHNKLPLPRALLLNKYRGVERTVMQIRLPGNMFAWYDVQASTIKGSRLMVSLPQ